MTPPKPSVAQPELLGTCDNANWLHEKRISCKNFAPVSAEAAAPTGGQDVGKDGTDNARAAVCSDVVGTPGAALEPGSAEAFWLTIEGEPWGELANYDVVFKFAEG